MGYFEDLNDLAQRAHRTARDKGFWDHARIDWPQDDVQAYADELPVNPSIIPEKLMLIVTEVAEAMEDFRDYSIEDLRGNGLTKQSSFGEELADVIIRVLDLSEFLDINIQQAVWNKLNKNAEREHMHGRRR